jgi:Tfp pilus assembly protein PilN
VRAVNLIPADQRRGAGGLAGRSGGVAYVLTGGLAVLVLLGIVYAFAVHNVAHKQTELAAVTQQASSVTAQANALTPYVQFAGVSQAEVGQVTSLAQSRFDWPSAMRQLALALPKDVTLTSFSANAGSGPVDADGAAGTSFSLTGCASTQREIANVLTNLATVPGVNSVALSNTVENLRKGKGASSGVASATGGSCEYVTFALAVNYTGSYTVPNSKTSKQPASGQTVSASAPTISTAASQQTTGVTP